MNSNELKSKAKLFCVHKTTLKIVIDYAKYIFTFYSFKKTKQTDPPPQKQHQQEITKEVKQATKI